MNTHWFSASNFKHI